MARYIDAAAGSNLLYVSEDAFEMMQHIPPLRPEEILEKMWISAKERLPESFERVLVCRKSRSGLMIEEGVYEMNGYWKVYGRRAKTVTHWMPLPEAPEEENT